MKALVLIASLLAASVSFASENSSDEIYQKWPHAGQTIVGGCAGVTAVGSGENVDLIYTGPCNTAESDPRALVESNYYKVFPTRTAAARKCNRKDEVIRAYGRGGWVCRELQNQNGGN